MNEVHNLVSFFQQVLKILEQTLKIFVSFNLHTRNKSSRKPAHTFPLGTGMEEWK